MRISDWSSDVCSSDLIDGSPRCYVVTSYGPNLRRCLSSFNCIYPAASKRKTQKRKIWTMKYWLAIHVFRWRNVPTEVRILVRSEEHTSELQSLMRISYAVFCLKKKTKNIK